MRNWNTLFTSLIFLLLTSMASIAQDTQDCYIPNSFAGLSNFESPPTVLTDVGCKIGEKINLPGDQSFKVVSYDHPPVYSYVNENRAFEKAHNLAHTTTASAYHHFLLVSKEHLRSGKIRYRVFLELPDIAPYNELSKIEVDAIANSMEQLMNAGTDLIAFFFDYYDCEIKGLQYFLNILDDIIAGNFQVTDEMYESDGWEVVPIDDTENVTYGEQFAGSQGPFVYSFGDVNFNGDSFSEMIKDNESALNPDISQAINNAYVITNHYTDASDMDAAEEVFNFEGLGSSASSELMVWMHFDLSATDEYPNGKVRVKSAQNFTEEKLNSILQELWVTHITQWVELEMYADSPYALSKEEEALLRQAGCDEWAWDFGKQCF